MDVHLAQRECSTCWRRRRWRRRRRRAFHLQTL
jgi:hypothetical protein